MFHRPCGQRRPSLATLAGGIIALLAAGGCLDSDIFKRFREIYGPGAAGGLASAIQAGPDGAEEGLRAAGAAVLEGLGAIIVPRTPSSANQAN